MILPFVVVKSAFTPKECADIVTYAKTKPVEEATIGSETGNKVKADIRVGKVRWLQNHDPNIYEVITRLTYHSHAHNAKNFGKDIRSMQDLQFSEYPKGAKFEFHQDTRTYPREPAHTPFDRVLSVCVQLTPRDDYEGGDFWIKFNERKQLVRDFNEVGDLIIFDSLLYHKVAEITGGERNSLVGWWWGPR